MNTKWFKMLGTAVVVGIIGVMAFGAVAFAEGPTPNNPLPWGFGHDMRGGFGMRGGLGNFATPQNSFFAIAAKALGMTETDLMAQLQQGKSIAELAKEKNVDTATIVTEALKQHEDALKTAVAQNVHVQVSNLQSLVVRADSDRVAQVLRNLLANALRHTPEGGTITLDAQPQEKFVRVTVRDTGKGIAPQDVPHVFERFYRADKSRTSETGGTGLGGKIGVESAQGAGSVFWFTLPSESH